MSDYKLLRHIYLRNEMPLEKSVPYSSQASPKPEYGFLYIDCSRCIEFIVDFCRDIPRLDKLKRDNRSN